MFLSFREKGNTESTCYQLPQDMSFTEAKNYGKDVIREKLNVIDPLIISRAVATLNTSSGLIAARIYLTSDRLLVWEDTDPGRLHGTQKKEMCRLLGFRSIFEWEIERRPERLEAFGIMRETGDNYDERG